MSRRRSILLAFLALALGLLACQSIPLANVNHLENGRAALNDKKYDEAIAELSAAGAGIEHVWIRRVYHQRRDSHVGHEVCQYLP